MKRLLFALALFVPALASAQVVPYPLGVSPPIFGLPASAVNSGGVVTSPQFLWPDGTVALPGLAPASDPNTGWYWTSDGAILMSINGVLTHQWGNTYYANSSNSACLQFGAAGDTTFCRLADSVWAPGSGDAYGLASKFAVNTAPSGPVACTNPTVTWSNGTAAFQIDVGGTCAGISTLVVTLPAVTTAWMCSAMNVTTSATAEVEMTASTTTTATFTNYTRTTGLVLVWVDGSDVRISCLGG